MDSRKRKRLEAAGWRVGDIGEFLGLTQAEVALIDFKRALAELVRSTRLRSHLSQQALAKRLRSSQSRVAKLEAGEPGVSLDLMVILDHGRVELALFSSSLSSASIAWSLLADVLKTSPLSAAIMSAPLFVRYLSNSESSDAAPPYANESQLVRRPPTSRIRVLQRALESLHSV